MTLAHEAWTATARLRHGFLDATACRDAASWEAAVARANVTLPVVTVRQVHGARVVDAAAAGDRPEADGIVTAAAGLVAGVVTADCVPALLVDREAGVAAAVHAGWRGAAAGVLQAALDHLRLGFDVQPGTVDACLGPAIGPCCYQVGAEVRDAFVARSGDVTAPAWRSDGARWRLDLRGAVQRLLEAAGVRAVTILGPCTACDRGYSSFRRDGVGAGRQLSFIGWA